MSKGFHIEIVTPESRFYSGEVESIVVRTSEGYEGFMADHSWCCKLLAEDGDIKLRRVGDSENIAITLKSGYIEVTDKTIVYTDKAEWKDEQQRRYYEEIK